MQGLFDSNLKVELEAWNKWTYVRNAIIHSGREVSADLTSIWRDRFPQLGDPLKLTDKDCTVVSSLAIKLGKIVDSGALENHIELSDGTLLVREFFIRDGIDDRRALSQKVQKILHLRYTENMPVQVIAARMRLGKSTVRRVLAAYAQRPDHNPTAINWSNHGHGNPKDPSTWS